MIVGGYWVKIILFECIYTSSDIDYKVTYRKK